MKRIIRLGESRRQFCSKLGRIVEGNEKYHQIIELVDEYLPQLSRDKHLEDTIKLDKLMKERQEKREKELKEYRIKEQTRILGRVPTQGEIALFEEYEEIIRNERVA